MLALPLQANHTAEGRNKQTGERRCLCWLLRRYCITVLSMKIKLL